MNFKDVFRYEFGMASSNPNAQAKISGVTSDAAELRLMGLPVVVTENVPDSGMYEAKLGGRTVLIVGWLTGYRITHGFPTLFLSRWSEGERAYQNDKRRRERAKR